MNRNIHSQDKTLRLFVEENLIRYKERDRHIEFLTDMICGLVLLEHLKPARLGCLQLESYPGFHF